MKKGYMKAGMRQIKQKVSFSKKRLHSDRPTISAVILFLIFICCLCAELMMTKDPAYLDLEHSNTAPCREFLFGTDTLGRDIFSMIWYGGRISLRIGIEAALISAVLAVVIGTVSGSAPLWVDALLMRLTEILLSVPGMLSVILLQAAFGQANAGSIAFAIGATSWMSMAKIVRTEVRQIRNQEYIVAAKCMGGRFFYVLWRHLAPNFLPSIMFMAVMNIRSAIAAEAALSFMGIGLPIETVSWGSMLSLAEKALPGSSWWVVLFPGGFLTVTLLCITNIGNDIRKNKTLRIQ